MTTIKQIEIFAVGKWNGFSFSIDDLKSIASAFSKLSEVHDVPLKMGHNEKQPLTDGQPALGWVEKIWVEGEKLMAKFIDMPEVVFSAINSKLYKKVSIELDLDVEYKSDSFPFVLSGVALLGADIPAVNTLADLKAYMSKEQSFQDDVTFKKRVAFTAINNEVKKEAKIMPTELEIKLQAQLDAVKAENAEHKKTTADFSKKQAETDAEIAKFKADKDASDKKAELVKFEAEKKEFETKLESLVKESSITPAQREKFTKDFDNNKDAALYAVEMFSIGKKDQGLETDDKANGNDKESGLTPDMIILTRAKELMLKTNTLDFNSCRKQVLRLDDDLAKQYANMNGGL